MSVQVQSELVFFATLAFYIIVPVVLCVRGWFIRAGLAMIAVSFAPIVWQIIAVPDSEAPGSGLLVVMLLPPALIVILVGIADLIYRGIRALRSRTAKSMSPASRG